MSSLGELRLRISILNDRFSNWRKVVVKKVVGTSSLSEFVHVEAEKLSNILFVSSPEQKVEGGTGFGI